jgi:hypothetical protein
MVELSILIALLLTTLVILSRPGRLWAVAAASLAVRY